MRAVHRGLWQSRSATWSLVALLGACNTSPDHDTIWPPPDFEVAVDELRESDEQDRIVRRFRVRADGVAFFATSSTSLGDATSKITLPVFDTLCIYQLVPTCTRALARRVHRAGVLELDRIQGERRTPEGGSVILRWQAFDKHKVVSARGRVHGAMAEILAIVAAHLPEGERLDLPGVAERAIAPVLRGVPAPVADPKAALEALLGILPASPRDQTLLLDAFALACHVGRRDVAENLLQQWTAETADARHEQEVFPEEPRLTPEILTALLPAAQAESGT